MSHANVTARVWRDRANSAEAEVARWEECRKSVAEIMEIPKPDDWPDHGNAPLAVAACVAQLLMTLTRVGQVATSWRDEADRIEACGGDSPDMVADYRGNAQAIWDAIDGTEGRE